jgi:prophage regulatory protein
MMSAKATVKPAYLDLAGACSFVALGESTLQKLIREDKFPKPRKLSDKRVGWLVRELEEWAESRPVSGLLPPAHTGAKKREATLNRDR